MKPAEQLSSVEMMVVGGVAPSYLILPHFWGVFISMLLFTLIFTAMGIIGGLIVGVS